MAINRNGATAKADAAVVVVDATVTAAITKLTLRRPTHFIQKITRKTQRLSQSRPTLMGSNSAQLKSALTSWWPQWR